VSATRRVYVYLVALAGLAMLAAGVANLLTGLITPLLTPGAAGDVRDEVSRWGAAALVGLPVWLVHWRWAQGGARTSADERASTLRRLYLYAVVAGATLSMTVVAHTAIVSIFDGEGRRAIAGLPTLLVGLVVWVYHRRVAAADRLVGGEVGGSAALRRWYTYGAAYLGLVMVLDGCQRLVAGLWLVLLTSSDAGSTLAGGTASALVGLALWLFHWALLPRTAGGVVIDQDDSSTLRVVYLFLGLVLTVGRALFGASQVLYYALGRLLGVDAPGGVSGGLLQAAAEPASVLLVYGVGWAYGRHAIRRQARVAETPRQAGVRRLYTYLVALLALAGWSVGVGGLLWTAADGLTNGPSTGTSGWWRDAIALSATLATVGLPVWLVHWRPRVDVDEARSLSRRLYLYATLAAGALALLGSAATAAYRTLSVALGAALGGWLFTDLARALAVVLVAVLLLVYHWRALRTDAADGAATAAATAATGAASALVRLRAADAAALRRALALLADRGVEVDVLPEDGLGRGGRGVLGQEAP